MKRLAASVVAAAVLGVGVTACGGTGKESEESGNVSTMDGFNKTVETTRAPTPTSSGRDSNDGDSDPNSQDDEEVFDYGQPASPTDERRIASVLKKYYTFAALDNGAGACAQIYSLMAEAITEDFGGAAGPARLRGKTCAVVETKAFGLYRHRLREEAAKLEVLMVRVHDKRGLAVLRFGRSSQWYYLPVRQEFGAWKIYVLSDYEKLP